MSPNKFIKNIQNLNNIYIKNRYIKIIKHKSMTLIIQKVKKIYINFWNLNNLLSTSRKSTSGKNNISLL